MNRPLLLAFAALLAAPASAQSSQQPAQPAPQAPQAPPKCDTPEHRQFDFWIGEWSVTDSAGATQLGSSSITLEEQGCLIHEHWSGAPVGGGGGTGQSLNAWDRRRQQWGQYWVDFTGNILLLQGGMVGKAMVLEGDAVGPRRTVKNRITWAPQPDGRVRQTWQSSTDGGQTWTVSFDGWYRRR